MKKLWMRLTIWVSIMWAEYTEKVLGPKCDYCGHRIKPDQPRAYGRAWKILVFHADPCYVDYHAEKKPTMGSLGVLTMFPESKWNEERFDSNIGLH